MKWLRHPNNISSDNGLAKSKTLTVEAVHRGGWDVKTPSTSQGGDSIMTVVQEAEGPPRDPAEKIEEWLLLTEVATKLRVALFPEIFGSTDEVPPVSCSGSALVERLVAQGFAPNAEEAMLLSNRLLRVGALSGTGGPAIFVPSEDSRYRFAVDRYALLAHERESEQLMDGTRVGGAIGGVSYRMIAELAQRMQDPKFGISRCIEFSGSAVVDWLIQNKVAGTRRDAVHVASALVRAGVFFADRCNFVDGETRYCFSQDSFKAAAYSILR